MNDFKKIIDVLKNYLAQDSTRKILDKDIANLLEINQARFATLKKRNVLPYLELLLFCKENSYEPLELFFDAL